MSDITFPVLGPTVPPMLGRASIMQRLSNDLTKATPSHISIVGPRYSGKTVLMHELAQRMHQSDSKYGAVVLWDLGHQTPESNEAFLKTLCLKLGEGLKSCGNEYGDHLLTLKSEEYGELCEIIDALREDGFNILVLMDGFDKPLSSGKLTRNLWDQLRELASINSLRLVTATRRPLSELLRSEESGSSDFWNIFDPSPVRVGFFNEDDRNAILATIPGLSLKKGALSEIENWTAGYPPLYLALINELIKSGLDNEIDNQMINTAAQKALEGIDGILQFIWNDCPETAKNLFRHLVQHGELAVSGIGKAEKMHLEEKGIIKIVGSKAVKGCRLLEHYVKGLGEDSGSMVRLFGNWEDYRRNIRSLLELRLGQIPSLDPTLQRFIQRGIEDIPDYPDVCLSNIRGIVDRALELIMDAELGPKREISEEWIAQWHHNGERDVEREWIKQFPTQRGYQIRLVQLMTGTQKSGPCAKRVSKNTWALVSAAHGFGDFGQHLDGAEIHLGVAVSALNICLELAACLERELGSTDIPMRVHA